MRIIRMVSDMKYIVNKKAYIDADFYSDNYKSAYDYIQESGDFKIGDKETRKKQYFYRGNVKSIIKVNSKNKLFAGLEYLDEKLESESDNISNKTLYTMALYAQDEWTIAESLQAVVGLRYIYNETFEDHFTPTASIMYRRVVSVADCLLQQVSARLLFLKFTLRIWQRLPIAILSEIWN